MALQAQRAQDSDPRSGLADLRGGAEYQVQRPLTIWCPGASHAELPDVQRLAAVPASCTNVAHSPKVTHFQMRLAGQLANHPGLRKNPVVVAWHEPAIRDAANRPPPRLTVPWRSQKDVAWSDRQYAASG